MEYKMNKTNYDWIINQTAESGIWLISYDQYKLEKANVN